MKCDFFETLFVLYLHCITPIGEKGQYWNQFIGSQKYDILNMLSINIGSIGSPYEIINYYNKFIPIYLVFKIRINFNLCTKVPLYMYLPNTIFYKLVTFKPIFIICM